MCGRYSLILTIGELQNRFEFDGERLGYAPGYNIAPTQNVLTVVGGESRRGGYMRWGLIPLWAKDMSIGSRMIRAVRNGRREAVLPQCPATTQMPRPRRRVLRVAKGRKE